MDRLFSNLFFKSGSGGTSATTTETTAAAARWHDQDGADANSPPVYAYRVIISNDELAGGENLLVRFSTTTGVDKSILKGGETLTLDIMSPTIFFSTAANTAAFRAWGLG